MTVQAALAITVLLAAMTDLTARRIPNWITVPGLAAALLLHAWYGGPRAAGISLAGAAFGCAIFLVLYATGGMGAGDVKLFTVVGAFVGPKALVIVFVLTGLLGGLAAIALAIARGRLRTTVANTGDILASIGRAGLGRLAWQEVRQASSLDRPDALRLPYGAVIASGALLSLLLVN